jgi:dipeptidyl aminopeptidase/acylaminoacyl peptidase
MRVFSKLLSVGLVLTASLYTVPTLAEDLAETATRFGARQSVTDVSISPSGDTLLYVSPGQKSEETIYTVDLNGVNEPKAIATFNEANSRITGCDWATDEQIVCGLFGSGKAGDIIFVFSRKFSINTLDGKVKSLTPGTNMGRRRVAQDGGRVLALDVPGEDRKILMTRRHFKEAANSTLIYSDKEGLGVDLVDVVTGRRKIVERPNRMAVNYIADEAGSVRIMTVRDTAASGYDGSEFRYLYRKKGSEQWLPLSSLDTSGELFQGFLPVAVDSKEDVVYGFERVDGYTALYKVPLDGSGTRELILKQDGVDVDGLVRIGRQDRVVGVSYATEARNVEYFDAGLTRISRGLSNALPGKPLVSVLDASEDENRIVLVASSDTDPGMVYLYDKTTRELGELMPLRDPLAGREMAEMKPLSYAASDGTQIPGFLTLPPGSDGKNLPAIVLPHGGPGSRDVWGFDWLPQFLAARGFAVLQPNFRGSAGYGEAWFGRNGFKSWDLAVGDVNDAGRWLVSQGIADPERLGVMGWSYGGYAALQSQVMDPDLFKAVVAIAPVTDLGLLIEESRNYSSFVATRRMIGSGPHLDAGSPARHAEKFKSPVFLVHGTMDLNVRVGQSKLMNSRLEAAGKPVDYLEFEGLDHSLVHSQARAIMLNRIGGFLESNLSE